MRLRLPWRGSGGALRTPELRAGALRLVAITPEMLRADESRDWARLTELLGATVTAEWPPREWEPHVYRFILSQCEEALATAGWHRYMLLCDALGTGRRLVGAVGAFPKAGGEAEIGYSTLPEFQRRGFATAAARALTAWLLRQDGVAAVTACTFPQMAESIKVMERCGMSYVGDGDEPGSVKYRRSR